MKKTDTKLAMTFFQADKADAILFQTSGMAVLMDAGLSDNSEELIEQLEERGVEKLDALIITHYDQDHVGGADTVIENIETEHVFVTYDSKSSDETESFYSALALAGLTATEIRGTQIFTAGGVEFCMYGAEGDYEKDESNNSSLIIEVRFQNQTYLFTGDAQDERIDEFLTSYSGDPVLLKVPYHGHYTDGLITLMNAVSPEAAVITNGEDEPGKKELKKTIALLEENGCDVYQTKNGTLTVTCTADSMIFDQETKP